MTTEPTDFDTDPEPAAATPPVPPPLPEFTAHAVARRAAAGVEGAEGDSMPVLEAFQKFLDAERRRARNRMLMLSAAFAGVLLIVIAAGIAAALSLMRPVQANLATLHQDINGSERRATRAARRVDQAMEQIAQRERKLRDEFGRDKQSAAEAQTELKQQTQAMKADMDRTREILRQLQQDNLRLREELRKGPGAPATGAAAGVALSTPPAPAPAGPAVEPVFEPEPPRRVARAAPAAARGPRALELSITQAGKDEGVAWRVSVPE